MVFVGFVWCILCVSLRCVCSGLCVSVVSGVCLKNVQKVLHVECVESLVCLCVKCVHSRGCLCGELLVYGRCVHCEVCV